MTDPADERRIEAAAKALCAPDHKSDPGSPLSCRSCITEAEGALQAADAVDPLRDPPIDASMTDPVRLLAERADREDATVLIDRDYNLGGAWCAEWMRVHDVHAATGPTVCAACEQLLAMLGEGAGR